MFIERIVTAILLIIMILIQSEDKICRIDAHWQRLEASEQGSSASLLDWGGREHEWPVLFSLLLL